MNKTLTGIVAGLAVFSLVACGTQAFQLEKQKTNITTKKIELTKSAFEKKAKKIEKVATAKKVLPTQASVTKPLYQINTKTFTVEPIDPNGNKKVVLITIDDVINQNAVKMAETLKKEGVSAIFFAIGNWVQSPEKAKELKEMSDMGFVIGDHTWDHRNLSTLSQTEQNQEILKAYDQIKQDTGKAPRFFRPPFGSYTSYDQTLCAQNGMILMNWTYGYDWDAQYENAQSLTSIMVNSPYLTQGAILLMHDHPWTAQALQGIIEGLKAKGYGFVDPKTILTIKPSA